MNTYELIKKYPLLQDIMMYKEVLWINPKVKKSNISLSLLPLNLKDIEEAQSRLLRFSPYIKRFYPETNGIIESPLVEIPNMQKTLEEMYCTSLCGKLMLKCDNNLPVAGSIKARGGIYEVLKHAENLAIENGILSYPLEKEDYSLLAEDKCKELFSKYSISVGSTGNLGLSIGIISALLGFNVYVHMSSDAKQWKKDLLRSHNVTVIEYASDYSKAVEMGRKEASLNPNNYFIDDENSKDLFLGYATAAIRLKKQLEVQQILVDENHPLFVYLPCGVGGGPGGIAFGLKQLFGDNVHCFFAEPTHAPAMLIGMLTELHNKICVQDLLLDNKTEADGLAVGRPSGFVGEILETLLSGICTVNDETLFNHLKLLADSENIYVEPSAIAGINGFVNILDSSIGKVYLSYNNLLSKKNNITHIVWATGGGLVPKDEMNKYYNHCSLKKQNK